MARTHALIIDDNINNVNILARLLRDQGLASIHVTNPTLIDSILADVDMLDIVFVDLEMPGLNGFEVLAQLKSDPRFISVPVIAYTVHISEMHEAHQRGFDGFVGKPIDPDKFPVQLSRILNGEPVWEIA